MSESSTVTLRFPRESKYYPVARLVVGGLATPLQMSYDALDDLQLALSSLLDSDDLPLDGEVTLRLTVSDVQMVAELGTFATGSVESAFEKSHEVGGDFDLRRLLDTIVDEVEIVAGEGGEMVLLTKHVGAVA